VRGRSHFDDDADAIHVGIGEARHVAAFDGGGLRETGGDDGVPVGCGRA
jgi:hypothetical protein